MKVLRLDHLVLTVENIDRTLRFYQVVLGMKVIHFAEGRVALEFGNQKINLHQKSSEFEPKAVTVQPGSADLYFIVDVDIAEFCAHCSSLNIPILQGPIQRTGAMGSITSVYIRDPDGNLLELSNYLI
ncbi:VOC family protein [Photobacterium damselae]|uniref:VOC family protein n=1 Tax=Photobacterium damselae TaxID=38293 RepID=UPI001EDEB9C2|nr:VOC family protein [Photobacterium damselae]MCG3811057.1 VOC family protein [Photobacterium damselae]